MAISLVTGPDKFSPAYNPIFFEFSSGNYTQCEFNYVCDLYVNGVLAVRTKAFPDLSGNGTFNIERVLQDYLTSDFNPAVTTFTINSDSICSYYVELRERYNTTTDCSGEPTLQAVSYTSATKYAFNAAFQYLTFPSFDQSSHILEDADSQPLTNMPDNTLIGLSDNFSMAFIHDYKVQSFQLKTYDSFGTLIDTLYKTNPYNLVGSPSVTAHRHLTIGAGPLNLNFTTFDGDTYPVNPISALVKYYEITFMFTSSPVNPISITKRFQIDSRCSPFKNYRLFWLNTLGGYDSYNFNLKSNRKVSVRRNEYFNKLGNDYSIGDVGKKISSVEAEENYTINSNWMTEAEAAWLQDLFTSPDVKIYTKEPTEVDLVITGLQYNSGFLNFQIVGTVAIGSTFYYDTTNTASFGTDSPGSGVITQDLGGGIYKTSVEANIDPGISIISSGFMRITTYVTENIPIIITNNEYQEKTKNNFKNINYSVSFKPAYNLNIQSL